MAANSWNTVMAQVSQQMTALDEAKSRAGAAATVASEQAEAARSAAAEATDAANAARTAAHEAQDETEKVRSAQARAQTLAGDASPTAAVTEEDGKKVFLFGIPRGPRGERGERGEKGDTGSSGVTFSLAGTVLTITTQ